MRTHIHMSMNKQSSLCPNTEKRSIYCKWKAKYEKVYRVCFPLHGCREECTLVYNHIWTIRNESKQLLNGQERKLLPKVEASLSDLYHYTGLLSEACAFSTHVKQSINTTTTTNDTHNEKFKMLANEALRRGKRATTEEEYWAEQQVSQGASSASAARRMEKPLTDHPPQVFKYMLSH